MNKTAIIGISAMALALGLGMNPKAQAYNNLPPTAACTAQNEGAFYYSQSGPYRYGQPYRLTQWECLSGQWYITEQFVCDYQGNCVPL